MVKKPEISITQQAGLLKSRFPNSVLKLVQDQKLIWEATLQPSPLSQDYKVKVVYEKGNYPKSFVTHPKPLKLAVGKAELPHVYDNKAQRLCLFYPDGKEWHTGKLLIRTIVPWISEWLYFYELWLVCGKWLGGGTVHEEKKDDSEINTKGKGV